MRSLSKSKLIAGRQCSKRLWLEIHRPELRADSAQTEAGFAVGDEVGKIAQSLYNAKGKGLVFDPRLQGHDEVIERTAEQLGAPAPLFEAGFAADGVRVYVDAMLPVLRKGERVWRMVEVKSSSKVKGAHLDDIAIQSFITRAAGVPLHSVALAHLDKEWVYPGGGDYAGLLKEVDVTQEALGRKREVKSWIAAGKLIARKRKEPAIEVGSHCNDPYPCGFIDHCHRDAVAAEYPVAWLPNKGKKLQARIAAEKLTDLRQVPDEDLNPKQLRVKTHTLAGTVCFDAAAAAKSLAAHKLPAFFLDFETVCPAVPIWKGTRPFQHIPFQFSLHHVSRAGKLSQQAFLDLSGEDPSRPLAEALIAACGERGPVFVYSGYERSRIAELAKRLPRLSRRLRAINERLVDLLPVAMEHYYHPDQQGSWSIKCVLPTIAPDLSYEALDGVQDGGMAMTAYLEALRGDTSAARKDEIKRQLLDYCHLDTVAMVRVWQHFTGRTTAPR